MPHFDVVVLGAGPGGYVAAIRAAQLGKTVAVVESRYWGGVCLNVGCIPSKALLRNAELAPLVRDEAKTFGISGDISFDFGAAFDRSRVVADGRVKGVHFLMKKNKITEFDGWGEFTDPHSLHVTLNNGGHENVTFDHVIIATGAATRLLPGTSLSERVVTYEEQITTRELPGSIIIAGAGAIGVEFAFVLRNYGVQVTIVKFLDRLLPLEDEAVSKELAKAYRKLGVDVLTSTKVEKIDDSGSRGRSPSRTRREPESCPPTRSCRPSASSRGWRATGCRSSGWSSPTAAPSRSTTGCARTCRTCTRSAT